MPEYIGTLYFEGPTSAPANLASLLRTFSSIPDLAPEQWGIAERKRAAYSTEAIEQLVASEKKRYPNFYASSFVLSRKRSVGYSARVQVGDGSVSSVRFTFRKPGQSGGRKLYEALDNLASKLPLIWGYMHPVAREGEEVKGMTYREAILCLLSVYCSSSDVKRYGLGRPCARTWYGPLLSDRIGNQRLLQVGAVPRGRTYRLDLADTPWSATIPDLYARQCEVLEVLSESGMFAISELDEAGRTTRTEPGPNWTPPPWILDLQDLPAVNKEQP